MKWSELKEIVDTHIGDCGYDLAKIEIWYLNTQGVTGPKSRAEVHISEVYNKPGELLLWVD